MANLYSTTLVRASNQTWTRAGSAPLDITGTLTIEFWIKLVSAPGSGSIYALVTKDDLVANRSYAIDYYNSGVNNLLRLGVCSNGTSTFQEHALTYTLPTGTWTHVAIVYDPALAANSRITFYINGVSQGNGSRVGSVTSIFNGNASLCIGSYIGYPTLCADAKLDEVRIWNTARTSGEISANYNKEISPSSTGLATYYQFENNGNDSTSNALTLTNNNSATFSSDVPFSGASPGQGFFINN